MHSVLVLTVIVVIFGVAGIRDYYAAQRVDSTVTIVKRHIVEFEEDCSSPRHPSESINDVPFLDSDDLEEFYDATMDQLSDVSEVGIAYFMSGICDVSGSVDLLKSSSLRQMPTHQAIRYVTNYLCRRQKKRFV